MIGLDTNVVLRIVIGDDPGQQRQALAYLRDHCTNEDPAWINRVVVAELMWVLEAKLEYPRERIAELLDNLLHIPMLRFEDHDAVRAALAEYRNGAGFADALIACGNAPHCATTVTFDKVAAKKLAKFTLLAAR